MDSKKTLLRFRSVGGCAAPLLALAGLFLTGLILAPPAGASPRGDRPPSSRETITFGSRTIELTLNHSDGGPDWDSRVRNLVVEAGPVLEDLIGVPYPGPDKVGISERTNEQLSGYAGLAGCSHIAC